MKGKNNWIRSIALGIVLAMSLSTSAITAMAEPGGGYFALLCAARADSRNVYNKVRAV